MKKSIFKKIGGLFLGLAMGLGVAVGVTAGNHKASQVTAASSVSGTYKKVTTADGISAGDTVIMVNSDATKALTGISTTSTKYGTFYAFDSEEVSDDKSTITLNDRDVEELTVEAGDTTGKFSFKGTSDISSYLYWTSGNSLNQNVTKNANTSWTVTANNGTLTIANCSTTTRLIRFNSDRFACYTTSTGTLAQLYKKETGSSKTLSSISVSGTMSKTSYNTEDKNWDFSGLTATGTFSDDSTEDITSSVTWSATPNAPTEGTTSISVVATKGSVSSTAYGQSVTVTKPAYIKFEGSTCQNMGTSKGSHSQTIDGITVSISDGLRDSGDAHLRIYSGATTTISSANNIEKIEFICVGSETSQYGSGYLSVNYGSSGSYSYSGNVGTWTGSAKNISFSASAQVRATSIKVYLETPKAVTGIAVKTAPTKVTYEAGDNFNPAGLVITATYEGGTTKDIAYSEETKDDFSFDPSTDLAQGTSSVTITYKEKTCTQTITVNAAKELTGVTLSGTMVTSYYNGETNWDYTGLTVTAHYSDESTADVTTDSTIVPNVDNITAGELSVYATYHSQNTTSLTFNITVLGSQANPMTIAQARTYIDSVKYSENNTMYVKGIISQIDKYNASYHSIQYWISDDGSTTNQFECYSGRGYQNVDFNSIDEISVGLEVTVVGKVKKYSGTYEFDTSNYIVAWNKAELESISIKTNQTQTAYKVGDTFNAAGLVITATYDDGSTKDVSYDDDSSLFSFTTVDAEGKVTITYNEKTCEQEVTLLAIADITGVQTAPSTVGLGKTIDPASVVLTATYNTGDATTVTPDSVTVDSSTIGTKTATATYSAATGTKTATFSVSVVKEPTEKTITIASIADQENWTESGNVYGQSEFTVDDFGIVGSGTGNNCKYYNTSSPETWRFYTSGDSQIVITAKNGVKLASVEANVTEGGTSFVLSNEDTVATSTGFSATTKIKSFTIKYYPAIKVESISLTDGNTTVSNADANPAFTLSGDTEFTASFLPEDSVDTLSWELKNASNMSLEDTTGNVRNITIGDLKAVGSATLEIKSSNVTLSVSLNYSAPEKVLDHIEIVSKADGQAVKDAYVVGNTFNPEGLKIRAIYTNSIYNEEITYSESNKSQFSFGFGYGNSGDIEEYTDISNAFPELGEGVTSTTATIKVVYTNNFGSDDVYSLKVTVTADITAVTDLSISNIDNKLDFFEHNTGKLTATVSPSSATEKGVKWEALTPELATIDENGNVTVVASSSNSDQTAKFRCTTLGLQDDGITGEPIVKEKSVVIHRHVIGSITVADENGVVIENFENFEAGKIYTLTANDTDFSDEDSHITWNISAGSTAASLDKTSGKTVKLTCTKTVGTLNVGATVHDSARKPVICSVVNQAVSEVIISADKTQLYTGQTATITLAVNEFATIGEVTWNISDKSIASVSGSDSSYTVSFMKQGVVTISATVDGVNSNEIEFDVVQELSPIIETGTVTKTVTFNGTDDFKTNPSQTIDDVTFAITSGNNSNATQIKILGTGNAGAAEVSTSKGCITNIEFGYKSGTQMMTVGDLPGDTVVLVNNNGKQSEINSVSITYQYEDQANISNTDFEGQKALVNWATKFMDNTDNGFGVGAICADGVALSHSWEEMESAWDAAKSAYNTAFGSLTSDDTVYKMFKAAEASTGGDILQQAIARYETIALHYGLKGEDLFISQRPEPKASRINPIANLSNIDNSVWVISAVALVGLTAIGGYFFYRKRKEI